MNNVKRALTVGAIVLFAGTTVVADEHGKKAGKEIERQAERTMEEGEKLKQMKNNKPEKAAKLHKEKDLDDHEDRAGEKYRERAEDSGSDTAREMRARRDERKAIKDEYKADVEAGGERVKGKKPWWKFWGEE